MVFDENPLHATERVAIEFQQGVGGQRIVARMRMETGMKRCQGRLKPNFVANCDAKKALLM